MEDKPAQLRAHLQRTSPETLLSAEVFLEDAVIGGPENLEGWWKSTFAQLKAHPLRIITEALLIPEEFLAGAAMGRPEDLAGQWNSNSAQLRTHLQTTSPEVLLSPRGKNKPRGAFEDHSGVLSKGPH